MESIQATAGGMPVIILREGTKESKGREAQRNNFMARETHCRHGKVLSRPKRNGQDAR